MTKPVEKTIAKERKATINIKSGPFNMRCDLVNGIPGRVKIWATTSLINFNASDMTCHRAYLDNLINGLIEIQAEINKQEKEEKIPENEV